MRIVLTGGAGFIGSRLAETLLEEDEVEALLLIDDLDPFYDRRIKEENLHVALAKGARFEELDIREHDKLLQMFRDFRPDLIFHLAAKAGVRPSLQKPLEYFDVNVNGTLSVVEAARESGVKKFIFASSSSIYGTNEEVPFHEDQPTDRILSVYGASKRSAEVQLQTYHNLYDLDCLALRLFTVYGPRQRPDLAIYKFMGAILQGDPITIYGDGSMARDYTYVEDIVKGFCQAKDLIMKQKTGFDIFNLGNSSPITLNELIQKIEKVSGKKAHLQHEEVPKGDVPATYANIEKAWKRLGYSPEKDMERGLKEFHEWFQQQFEG